MLKILHAKLQHYVNQELLDVHTRFRKGRGTRDQIANICWIIEKVKALRRLKVPVLGLHLTNGSPRGEDRCCSFPASEEEPVRKMERPAGPRPRPAGRLTDASSCAAPGCQGPAFSVQRAPCAPPRAPPDLSAPSMTQDPAFQGQRARLWASLGWGPWPDGEDRAGVRL